MERYRPVITIADILNPKHVTLDLKATSQEEAVFQVAELLKADERVLDWGDFYDALKAKSPCLEASPEFDVSIPHARTNAVNSMVMSVGRSAEGVSVSKSDHKLHYIFVIGVPVALASDYLRIIGALARILKNAEKQLRQAATAQEFVSILIENEMAL